MAEAATRWKDPNTGEVVEWDGQQWQTVIQPYKNLPQQAISNEMKENISSVLTKAPSAIGSAIETINAPFEWLGNRVGEGIGETVRSATQPMLGPTGSAIAGTALGAPANVATQLITPGLAVKGALGGIKMGTRLLPGSQAARIEIGIDKLKAATNVVRPSRSSSSIYEEVAQTPNPSRTTQVPPYSFELGGKMATVPEKIVTTTGIPTPELSKMLDKLIAVEEPLSAAAKDNSILRAARSLKSKIEANNGTIDLHEFGRELTGIGENVKALRTQGKRVHGGFAQMFRAAADDLERLPGGKLLREAAETYRKEQAINELDDIIDSTILLKRGSGTKDINANRVIKQIEAKPFLQESFGAGELNEVKDLLHKLVEMPALPAPRGAARGFGQFGMASGGTAGPAVLSGMDPQVATAMGVTFAAVMEVSRMLLPSPIGRKVLRQVLESGPIDVNKINRLNAVARGLTEVNLPLNFGDDPKSKQFKSEFKDAMKDAEIPIEEKIRINMEKGKLEQLSPDKKKPPRFLERMMEPNL